MIGTWLRPSASYWQACITDGLLSYIYIYIERERGTVVSSNVSHPWWWEQRWSSKRRFPLYILRGWLTYITFLMMKTEMVFETSVSFIHLTRLIALYHIPNDEDRDGLRNVGFLYKSDEADCPVSHSWWWGQRWSSKRRFPLYICVGWLTYITFLMMRIKIWKEAVLCCAEFNH
jgi:hypothetical protein